MSFLFRKGKNIPPNATFRITQVGQEKLQDFSGDPRSRILVALESGGTIDVSEISAKSGVSRGKVERMIPVLIHGGYVSYVSASSLADGE